MIEESHAEKDFFFFLLSLSKQKRKALFRAFLQILF